ncbi:NinE family protein, partial [Escherichia coli]|nr:NinE family protein [Escherichia coli]
MKQTIFLRTKQQQQAAINAILATPLDKDKPIPKESDVKTFNYTAHLW